MVAIFPSPCRAKALHSKTPTSTASADGTPLYVGTRVQTQWTREEGGDDRWYAGRVVAMLASGEVTIKYDDGDNWTGMGVDVHLLDDAHPLKRTVGVADRVQGYLSSCLICFGFLVIIVQPLLSAGDERTGETGLWYLPWHRANTGPKNRSADGR